MSDPEGPVSKEPKEGGPPVPSGEVKSPVEGGPYSDPDVGSILDMASQAGLDDEPRLYRIIGRPVRHEDVWRIYTDLDLDDYIEVEGDAILGVRTFEAVVHVFVRWGTKMRHVRVRWAEAEFLQGPIERDASERRWTGAPEAPGPEPTKCGYGCRTW